jgi:leucyl aminopeptidase (aminopeptidase T)
MRNLNRRHFLISSSLVTGMEFLGTGCGGQKTSRAENSKTDVATGPFSAKLKQNAKIVLEESCRAKEGETLLILADEILLPYVPALSAAALDLGLIPTITDIRDYLKSPAYSKGYVLQSLKSSIESSDIVIQNLADTWVPNRPDYGRLLGKPEMQDAALTSERRWMIIQPKGMEEWNITREQVASIRKRTLWLMDRIKTAKSGRITSKKGTDFTFGLGSGCSFTPILGIIPFYGEVAIVPDVNSTNGIFVTDGPTQRDVRPRNELDREPFNVEVEAGRVKNIKGGDPEQIKRLKEFIASGNPAADAIDEVGLVTTGFVENDRYYWSDGTHHHDTVHIALGNNAMRNALVHGPKHMDCEVLKPTISIDGLVIIENGVFKEDVITS